MNEEVLERLGNEIDELRNFSAMVHISVVYGIEPCVQEESEKSALKLSCAIDDELRHFSERLCASYAEISAK
jgi:hypothetical protein